jgi:cytidylate kinase
MEAQMPTSTRGYSELAERQMRNWALNLQAQQQKAEKLPEIEPKNFIHPYLAISREAGVEASTLARAVGTQLGWKVFDDELLDYIAEHEHMSRVALEFVDERAVSWFHEMFCKLLESHLVSQAEYVSRLGKMLLLASQHESAVFVGRGVRFILPRDRGFAVRVIAPIKQRIKTIMERKHCSEREAKTFIESTDREREQFVRRYFLHEVTDPHQYDLVINLAHIPREEAVDVIVNGAKRHAERALASSRAEIQKTTAGAAAH